MVHLVSYMTFSCRGIRCLTSKRTSRSRKGVPRIQWKVGIIARCVAYFETFIVLASNSRSIAAHKTALAEEQAKKEEAIKKHEEEVKALEGSFTVMAYLLHKLTYFCSQTWKGAWRTTWPDSKSFQWTWWEDQDAIRYDMDAIGYELVLITCIKGDHESALANERQLNQKTIEEHNQKISDLHSKYGFWYPIWDD